MSEAKHDERCLARRERHGARFMCSCGLTNAEVADARATAFREIMADWYGSQDSGRPAPDVEWKLEGLG